MKYILAMPRVETRVPKNRKESKQREQTKNGLDLSVSHGVLNELSYNDKL